MYKYTNDSYDVIEISHQTIKTRLAQEGRLTKSCPYCEGVNIDPVSKYNAFYMECQDCLACGPWVWDYSDPAGLNPTSWIYALKVSHDRWNGRVK